MLAKTKNDPSSPGSSVHQRTVAISSLNPAVPLRSSRMAQNSTIPTSELSSIAMRMVEADCVIRTISIFCTTSPTPAAVRNSRLNDEFIQWCPVRCDYQAAIA
ncbi:hypothetical protein BN129_1067 [Cronobacter sakazakii 701]|nr:hypothetical protein BN129_1067 [Cronobacter sakazakii 701]